jgi:RNA polymerase sigma factor (sigma-70 family)
MAGKQLADAVRQVQKLFNVGTTSALTDDQLLAQFILHKDDAAFEALVERHGPMVLSVCRGVLKDPNDAQDAFQATLLVLVKQARSIRAGASLAGWLYRVAYNMSVRVNADIARRRRLERRARDMATPMPRDGARADNLVPALYEEVNRLAEKYRLPVVLCYLEELTHAQAAQRLGWTEGTVRGRVARARQTLRRRLARRGLALSTAALASALVERSAAATSAAVPSAWIEGTVRAAMAGPGAQAAAGVVSSAAIALSEQMAWSMSLSTLRWTMAALLAASGAALLGAGIVVPGSQHDAMRTDIAPAGARAAPAPDAKNKAPLTQAREQTKPVTVTGQVVEPDGRPVGGARLYVTRPFDHFRKPQPPAAVRATTGADGRFAFKAAHDELPVSPEMRDMPLVALADGFGPGLALEPDKDKTDAYTIHLVRDDIPVEGRILDAEGRPVAAARIRIIAISWLPGEDLTRWRAAVRAREGAYDVEGRMLKWWSSPAVSELLPAATTGADGRFTMRGIGRERIARIRVEGPSIRTTIERVVTRRDPTMRVPDYGPGSLSFPLTFYGARFDHVAEPSRPVAGVVRDKDTGKPIAGAVVRTNGPFIDGYPLVETTTGADGRYRLDGLMLLTEPKDRSDDLVAIAREDQPYLPAVQSMVETLQTKTLTRDFALKRGIWIKGRVIDKATGQPHRASVAYYIFKDNPHAPEAAALGYDVHATGRNWTGDDGSFRLIGLPGRGLLCVRAGNEPYRMGMGAERIKDKRKIIDLEAISLIPEYIYVNNFHVLAEINPPEGVEEATFELALDRGDAVKGRVLDPQGQPLAGVQLRGLADWWDRWDGPLPTAAFEVVGLAPADVRQLAFLHRERRLSGSMILRGKVPGPIEVKLGPWGTVTGRLVDAAGQPRPGVELGWPFNQKRRVEEGPGSMPEHVKTDANGRFRIEGLAPGLKYRLDVLGNGGSFGAVFKNLSIQAGETRDLGDVTTTNE